MKKTRQTSDGTSRRQAISKASARPVHSKQPFNHLGTATHSTFFSDAPLEEFGYYAGAYLRAGRTLWMAYTRRKGNRNSDLLPILFIYRHALELLAKQMILLGNEFAVLNGNGKTVEDILRQFGASNHRLSPMAGGIKQTLRAAGWDWHWDDPRIETFDDVSRLLNELDRLDPKAITFRYPATLTGEHSGPKSAFPLVALVRALDVLCEAFDTAVFGLRAELEQLEDCIAEMRSVGEPT